MLGSPLEGSLRGYARDTLLSNGRYRIEKELNRGATAIVYAAEDLQLHTYVALKVMNCPDEVMVKVVKREITFSKDSHHANIVQLLDVFAEGNKQLVIVWELVAGPDLLELLNQHGGRMPEPMAAFYFLQLLRGVLFMHAAGFCHRDIKPENCMVERSSHRLKLIDFGLSKHLHSVKTLGVGTPDYMPPEMLQQSSRRAAMPGAADPNAPPYDAKSVDGWAMGVMMYLLVTGKFPFEDPAHPNSLAHTLTNLLQGRMRPLPDTVTPPCAALITSLLQVRPGQRARLEDVLHSPWLLQQAWQYAAAIGATAVLGVQPLAAALPQPPPAVVPVASADAAGYHGLVPLQPGAVPGHAYPAPGHPGHLGMLPAAGARPAVGPGSAAWAATPYIPHPSMPDPYTAPGYAYAAAPAGPAEAAAGMPPRHPGAAAPGYSGPEQMAHSGGPHARGCSSGADSMDYETSSAGSGAVAGAGGSSKGGGLMAACRRRKGKLLSLFTRKQSDKGEGQQGGGKPM